MSRQNIITANKFNMPKIILSSNLGASTTVSGKLLPSIMINGSSGDSHSFLITDREAFTGIQVY